MLMRGGERQEWSDILFDYINVFGDTTLVTMATRLQGSSNLARGLLPGEARG